MLKIDLKIFIIPTDLSNTDEHQNTGNKKFDTRDLVFLDSSAEVKAYNESCEQCKTSPTDYALVNGAFHSWLDYTKTGKRGVANIWLRSADSKWATNVIGNDGDLNYKSVKDSEASLCPALRLDASALSSAKNANPDIFKIASVHNVYGEEIYHTIEFGEYPKTYVGERLNSELERVYQKSETGFLKPTERLSAF